ncbi:MAG: hypothetical protein KA198_09895 [Chitinophagaceae bacterium]|nr:hypothetical protein [Chitinophagaceae bacterium]
MDKKAILNKLMVQKNDTWWDDLLILVLGVLISIPLYILGYRLAPDFNLTLHIDKFLLFTIIFVLSLLILYLFKRFVIFICIIFLIAVLLGSLSGKYGPSQMVKDYQSLIYAVKYRPLPEEVHFHLKKNFPNEKPILIAINYREPIVRNFAVKAAGTNFREMEKEDEYRTIIQCFSIFKEVRNKWYYVRDPKSRDYFAKASESLQHFSGDCDDYTIFMCACFKAIGGVPRIVRNPLHLYPELLIGKTIDLNRINYLIKHDLFPVESKDKTVKCHTDGLGQIWMNMDYSASYPGGPFLHKEIDGILYLDK